MRELSTGRGRRGFAYAGLSSAAIVALGLAIGAQPAVAANGSWHKVTICHATSSATNPFTVNSVDVSSIANLARGNGHGEHADDIIPPFTDLKGTSFAGQNWSPDAQAFIDAGCTGDLGGGDGGGDGDT